MEKGEREVEWKLWYSDDMYWKKSPCHFLEFVSAPGTLTKFNGLGWANVKKFLVLIFDVLK